jgi:hypothetical protein
MKTQVEVDQLISHIEVVIAAVAAGDLPAETDQLAWLRGVLAGLRSASD